LSGWRSTAGDLLDDFKQPVGFLQFLNFFLELELLDDLAGAGGKPSDVVAQIAGKLIGVAQQFREGKFASVVESSGELLVDYLLNRFVSCFGTFSPFLILVFSLELLVQRR